jgi:uncharacterized lipoprotein YajG
MMRSALAAVALVALTGCASTPGATLAAAPLGPAPVAGAEAVGVRVRVDDERFYKSQALADQIQASLEQGLAARGFHLAADGVRLEVAVQHVYWDVETSVWSGRKDSAEVVLHCHVEGRDVAASFSRSYSGVSGARSWSPAGQVAKEAARVDAVNRVLADDELLGALVGTAGDR